MTEAQRLAAEEVRKDATMEAAPTQPAVALEPEAQGPSCQAAEQQAATGEARLPGVAKQEAAEQQGMPGGQEAACKVEGPGSEECEDTEQEAAAASLAALFSAPQPDADPLMAADCSNFASVVEALSLPLPADRHIRGARPPQAHRQSSWAIQFKICREQGWVGGLGRQEAAVANDLVLARRRCHGDIPPAQQPADWNVSGARYEEDELLQQRLRFIHTAPAMQRFLQGLVKRDGPPPPKRRRRAPDAEKRAQQAKQRLPRAAQGSGCVGGGSEGQGSGNPTAEVSADLRSWDCGSDGWWRRRLSATTVARAHRLGLHASVFEQLAGRPPQGTLDELQVIAVDSGRSYQLSYKHYNHWCDSGASYLQGSQLRAWVQDTRAKVGDIVAMKHEGEQVLVRLIPTIRAVPADDEQDAPHEAQQAQQQESQEPEGLPAECEPAGWDAAVKAEPAEEGETSEAAMALGSSGRRGSPPGNRSDSRIRKQWELEWHGSQQQRSPTTTAQPTGLVGDTVCTRGAECGAVKQEEQQLPLGTAAPAASGPAGVEVPAPPAGLLSSADAAGSGSLPGGGPALADRAAQARLRKVQQALEAFAAADTDNPDSMLRPLRLLVLANKGGPTLRDVVHRWATYSLAAQQDVFDAALIAAEGHLEGLEEQVQYALLEAAA